jgi:ribosomal protein S12 methylthiotransferase accessory factor
MLDKRQQALMEHIGVTRVARVTGLDRTGVEVACAVRPGGHVLQVCNGKGRSFQQAADSALGEAAELHAAENPEPYWFRWGSARELLEGHDVWLPQADPDMRMAWTSGVSLFGGPFVHVPAQAVYCPPQSGPSLGPAFTTWTTNGMGAHRRREDAMLHAYLEAIERDQLARALPDGITEAALEQRAIDLRTLGKGMLRAAELVERLQVSGFDVCLLELTPPGRENLRLPVAGALLVDREAGPVPIAAGYACRMSWDRAFSSALMEAAQSRLTDVHGAREDVQPMPPREAQELRDAIARSRPRRRSRSLRDAGELFIEGRDALPIVAGRLKRAGFDRAAAVSLGLAAETGMHVFKAIVPGFLVSELL